MNFCSAEQIKYFLCKCDPCLVSMCSVTSVLILSYEAFVFLFVCFVLLSICIYLCNFARIKRNIDHGDVLILDTSVWNRRETGYLVKINYLQSTKRQLHSWFFKMEFLCFFSRPWNHILVWRQNCFYILNGLAASNWGSYFCRAVLK